jgi:hypothetical protein
MKSRWQKHSESWETERRKDEEHKEALSLVAGIVRRSTERIEDRVNWFDGRMSPCECCERKTWNNPEEAQLRKRMLALTTRMKQLEKDITTYAEKPYDSD